MRKPRYEKLKSYITDENGSTLITVIVAIAFVTILTSIILGTSVMNVRMKGIDKLTKDDFYYAEKALNEVYTGLGQDLAVKAADKYEEAFKLAGSSDDYNHAENVEKYFRQLYLSEVHKVICGEAATPDVSSVATLLNGYITQTSKMEKVDKVAGVEYQDKDGKGLTSLSADARRVAIKGVQISANDASFHAVINTDIIIDIPTVDFLGANADVSDYGLIANKGLYILGNYTTSINGNVYAGVHASAISGTDDGFSESTDANARSGVFGGINIKDAKAVFTGNYIVSKGDINLTGDSPEIEVNSPTESGDNPANLWFTSLRTLSNVKEGTVPQINIRANTFALNDLALNADRSNVTIKGNYYGYNDKTLSALGVDTTKREDGVSSAIVINGTQSSLDMTKLDNFVLMGKAYIDFTSDSDTNAGLTTDQIVPTAEGVALKTNQQLYLVPTDFLNEPNPMIEGEGENKFTLSIDPTEYRKWFGYKYLRSRENPSDPSSAENLEKTHKRYELTMNQDVTDEYGNVRKLKVYYDYLVFDDYKTWKYNSSTKKYEEYRLQPGEEGYEAGKIKYKPLGTGGAISSKAAFFFDIMNTENVPEDTTKEENIVQPNAYRLHDRIERSITNPSYFDLKKCFVGKAGDVHYYAKNAIVNYERAGASDIQTTVFENTEGMGRYANYPQNLFHRYEYLCTRLDGREKKLLDVPPEKDATELAQVEGDWGINSSTPMSHFIHMVNLSQVGAYDEHSTPGKMNIAGSTKKAKEAGIKPSAYGVVIATSGTVELDNDKIPKVSSNTFRGVVIVDGDIVVPKDYTVEGLLMATGTITLKGNNTIKYDKGLIQSRIDKEMNIIKNDECVPATWDNAVKGKDYYLVKYLTKMDGSTLMYKVDPGTKIKRDRIEADYNEFMHYENWKKGEQ